MASRRSYTAAFKLRAIKFSLDNGTSAAANKYEVSEGTIREWKRNHAKLKQLPATKRACRYKRPKTQSIEDPLHVWILKKREAQRAVLVKGIKEEALRMAAAAGYQNFTASPSWCQAFMQRKKLSFRSRTSVGQPLPDDYEAKALTFRRFVLQQCLYLSPHNIGNVDEVPVPFDVVHGRTVDTMGVDSVRIDTTGHEKSNFTVVLSVTSSGEKLKPLIIFKKKLIPKEPFPPNVIIKANDKGWMNQALMDAGYKRCGTSANTTARFYPNP